jgi:ABC-2 type transport system ATP-binding protein
MPKALDNDLAIKAVNLTKYYGARLAVDHISFGVGKGELFGFLGPNGAGKTTTVRILTGIIKADEGNATVMAHPAGSLEAKQITGVVPELANAYPDLSAWNNLMLMIELYGTSRTEGKRRAATLLEELGLYDRKDDLVKGFSRGMKQRLLLCMALVSEPRILFLDEPTTGLDVQSTRLIRAILRNLKQAGKTIFLTTHNMEEANELCDRVAIINHGRIATIDDPDKLRVTVNRLHSVEVSFDKPVNIKALSELPTVNKVERVGDRIKLYTDNPCRVVALIVDYSRAKNIAMIDLRILSPSLEDAFVKLIEEGNRDS